jgi:hypothetical protein
MASSAVAVSVVAVEMISCAGLMVTVVDVEDEGEIVASVFFLRLQPDSLHFVLREPFLRAVV